MAMKVRYNVVNGKIVSEQRGGVKSFYVPDAIGSTIAITDSAGTVTDRISYWPYGKVASRSGSNTTPFLFCGALGYLYGSTGLTYIRARYLSILIGRWITPDPDASYNNFQDIYSYVRGAVTVGTDPSGKQPAMPPMMQPPMPIGPPMDEIGCDLAFITCRQKAISQLGRCTVNVLVSSILPVGLGCAIGCAIISIITGGIALIPCGAFCGIGGSIELYAAFKVWEAKCSDPCAKAIAICEATRKSCKAAL